MQFKVPQFIDIEDKIFGPFTFREFIFLLGGGGMIFIIYKILGFWLGLILIIPVAGFTIGLVFVKFNGKTFLYYVEAFFNYVISNKLYIWKQRLVKKTTKEEEKVEVPTKISNVPMLSENKLKDLSWSLDVQERNNQ